MYNNKLRNKYLQILLINFIANNVKQINNRTFPDSGKSHLTHY